MGFLVGRTTSRRCANYRCVANQCKYHPKTTTRMMVIVLKQIAAAANRDRHQCSREKVRTRNTIPTAEKTSAQASPKGTKLSAMPPATAPIPVALLPESPRKESKNPIPTGIEDAHTSRIPQRNRRWFIGCASFTRLVPSLFSWPALWPAPVGPAANQPVAAPSAVRAPDLRR
jgi:hypothetical protein